MTDSEKSKIVTTFARLIIEILIIDPPPDLALKERACEALQNAQKNGKYTETEKRLRPPPLQVMEFSFSIRNFSRTFFERAS